MHLISKERFLNKEEKGTIDLFTLTNANGIHVQLTNYGARIVSVFTPDKYGIFKDIVLGYDTLSKYLNDKLYMGCMLGRYANRISAGKIKIKNKEYHLAKNGGQNTLHGGHNGFDKKIWTAVQNRNNVRMKYTSVDGEEGFPGNLEVNVSFFLSDSNQLEIDYIAKTDKETVVNLSHHTYFNLSGKINSGIHDHFLMINAENYTPVDKSMIPTGKIESVENTPFDFRKPKRIGENIENNHPQLLLARGYDHNWVLNADKSSPDVVLYEPESGRRIELRTNKPGLQFFSGNFGEMIIPDKNGGFYKTRSGLALEPQFFPNSPNQPDFPESILKPGETYHYQTIIKFVVD